MLESVLRIGYDGVKGKACSSSALVVNAVYVAGMCAWRACVFVYACVCVEVSARK